MNEQIRQQIVALRRRLIEKTFARMNGPQRKAVFAVNGPVLILAGAGSGKTTVLINRVGNLIRFGNAYHDETVAVEADENDVALLEQALAGQPVDEVRLAQLTAVDPPRPWEILAITFTNKAAGELKERLHGLLGEDADSIWALTFHSACLRMLRKFADRIGYTPHFTVYDTDDSKRVIKECQKELGLDDKLFPHRMLLNEIGRAKDQLITPAEYAASAGADFRLRKAAVVYELYQQKLKAADAMDFDDIIAQMVFMLQQHPDILRYYQNRFRYIMVDEYQDTNHAQYVLVKLLAGAHQNVCVVGDDNQSIYTFRGATIENILNFEQEYPNAVTIRLEQNYRSTGNILNAANQVIKNNKYQKEKNLWTDRGDGEKITCFSAGDEFGEARFVAEQILDSVGHGAAYADHVILYRMNAQSSNFETAFMRSGIPYRVIGGLKFYDRKEVKDALAYLKLLVNPSDNLRLRRIINEPKRGIGAATLEKVADLAGGLGVSMFEIIAHAQEYPDLQRSAGKLTRFAEMMQSVMPLVDELPPHAVLEEIMDKSGYIEGLSLEGDEGEERKENVKELVSSIMHYESEAEDPTLDDYLDGVSLMTDIDQYNADQDAVCMMTIHAAKGLEFDTVFIVGLEEGVFPGNQSIYATEKEMEEERRLMYVGITRAKRRLFLTNAYQRLLFGMTNRNRPSRFLQEIPMEYLNVQSPPRGAETSRFSGLRPGSVGGGTPSFIKNAGAFAGAAQDRQPSPPDLKAGDRVRHKTFGSGLVIDAVPAGGDVLLTIAFDSIGTKKLMLKFAKLQKE